VDTPLGLRDRAMLELMYASGLRVSELVGLKTVHLGLNEGVLRVMGKGSKERLVPFGEEAQAWLQRYLAEARAPSCSGQADDALFVTGTRVGMTRQMFWKLVKRMRARRHHRAAVAAHAAPRLRHPPAEPRRRPARGADAAGPCRHLHHHHLHPRGARAAAPLHAAHHPRAGRCRSSSPSTGCSCCART
jgi:integrase/recombinase XerD